MQNLQAISFQDAITASQGGKRHLLLGNGFSIDWKSDIFQYGSLFKKADFAKLSVDHDLLFQSLLTQDFESVMRALQDAAILAEVYKTIDSDLAPKMRTDADVLKEVLVETIATHHPPSPNSISDEEYKSCREFLSHFSGNKIYTLNYDLLLYWVLMHDEHSVTHISCDDGFRKSEEQEDYIVWNSLHGQNIYFLHGALHLFDHGHEVEKYTWINTGVKLMDQIRQALDQNRYPLIVTEGTKEQKLKKISHSGFLHKALRSFEEITGSLFIHGHSLAINDDHFIDLIPYSKVKKLFVSILNPADSARHEAKFNKMTELIEVRKRLFQKSKSPANHTLEVYYYDAETAHVWR